MAAAIFQLVTGLANSSGWYPWSFSFRSTHYAVAWIAIGALVVHIAVKLPIIRAAYAEPLPEPARDGCRAGAKAAQAAAPSCARPCSPLRWRSSRQPGTRCRSCARSRSSPYGPEKVPRESRSTGPRRQPAYSTTAVDPAFELTLVNGDREVAMTRADLEEMTQRVHQLPIACVEGWSAAATWTGVRFAELLDLVDAPENASLRVRSLQQKGAFGVTEIPASFARDPLTLLALKLNGRRPDHRPRLPVPADRPQPARCHADQVGHPDRGARMRTRLLIGALGVAMGAFGALRFLQLDFDDIVNAVLWLAGGVLVHDAIIAPLTLLVTLVAGRLVPVPARTRVLVGVVVLVTVTVTAIPVLGRWGARPDNPTLLDRNYVVGWLVFAALVLLGTLLAGPLGRLRRRRQGRVSRSAG